MRQAFFLPRLTRMSTSLLKIYTAVLARQEALVATLNASQSVVEADAPKSPSDNLLESEGLLEAQPEIAAYLAARSAKPKITSQLSDTLQNLVQELTSFNEARRDAPRPTSELIKSASVSAWKYML